jgi:hypothetical protein
MAMKAGFAKNDITPPVGTEMCGFGPFLRRRSNEILDNLYAKAIALQAEGTEVIIVSCDLTGLQAHTVRKAKGLIKENTGVPEDHIMIACTHTHSGPVTIDNIGWGEIDHRYLARLPGRIAHAAIQANKAMADCTINMKTVHVKGIAQNRVYKTDGPLDDKAVVITFTSEEKPAGFISYYSCHPVVCCQKTHKIHGDFVGVASNRIAQKNNVEIGMFLQGACGDINSKYVHLPEDVSLKNLEEMAEDFGSVISSGIESAESVPDGPLVSRTKTIKLKQTVPDRKELEKKIAEAEKILAQQDITENDEKWATFDLMSSQVVLKKIEQNITPETEVELQCIRIGEILLVSHPFELFNSLKKEVESAFPDNTVLVIGYTNDSLGYAPSKDRFECDGKEGREADYATYMVPRLRGVYPFTPDLGEMLVHEMVSLCKEALE